LGEGWGGSKMKYNELEITKIEDGISSEIVIAFLAEIGYDSFSEIDSGLKAYIVSENFNENLLKGIISKISFEYSFSEIKDQNWNAVWESNFEAVVIADRCIVRAPFHKADKKYEMDIIIEPRMSFGTAHHETTEMMIEWTLETDLKNKTVLDMGCGTGVLAIIASKKGASEVVAIDNDEWAYNNSLENIKRNNTTDIDVYQGDASLLGNKKYDIIFANINRNILLKDLPAYVNCLNQNGMIFLSGFYEIDIEVIEELANKLQLKIASIKLKNGWASVCFFND